jgi:penicillin amidase
VPAQNMLTADRSGNIAIRSTGKYPIRPGDGSGLHVFDGTTTKSDWIGFWTPAEYPQAKNPAQGFLASANQQPIDPKVNPRYHGAAWAPPWRAMRINDLLRADSAWTPEKFRTMQTDPGSARADFFAPRLIASGEETFTLRLKDVRLQKGLALLRGWDRKYTRLSTGATFFELVMNEVERRTWDELRPADTTGVTKYLEAPYNSVLALLFTAPKSGWWDDRRTPGIRETREDIIAASIIAAWDSGAVKYGSPQDPRWQWGQSSPMRINHLLRLEPFAATGLQVQSGPQTISPRSAGGTNGSSWRMIVQLGDSVHAWATYPGGQSGNPFSSRYTDRVMKWANGELDPLFVPASAAAMPADKVRSELLLRGGGSR